jgi:hypothetical protein
MTVIALFVLLALWIGSGFVSWKHCTIPLPDGSGSVEYMARLSKTQHDVWDRKARIQLRSLPERFVWLPCDCLEDPANVYWYRAEGEAGAYLRFQEPSWEYLVDLKHGRTLLVAREEQSGHAYVGELTPDKPETFITGPTLDVKGKAVDNTVEVEICGRPGRRLDSHIASKPGKYIGRIENTFSRFVPSTESPEAALPQH